MSHRRATFKPATLWLAFALILTVQAWAQTTPLRYSLWVEKRTSDRHTSATTVAEEGALLIIRVTYQNGTEPYAPSVELRSSGASLEIPGGTSRGSYELSRPFNDRESMERVLPDGTYTLVTPAGSASVNVSANATFLDARLTNYDAVQRWNGRDSIVCVAGPTSASSAFAVFSVNQGGFDWSTGDSPLTAPSTTLSSLFTRLETSPGEVLEGKISFLLDRSTGSFNDSIRTLRKHTLLFPVTRAHLPPSITTHPTTRSVPAGTSVSLSVAATGNALSYLWLKNSIPIVGATNATLSFASPQPSDTGDYSAVVSNSGGAVVSTAARLSVNAVVLPPSIAAAPAAASPVAGARHTLSVTAAGTPPYSYQWFRNGDPVTGATGATLGFDQIRPSDSGSYTVAINNAMGSVTSSPVVLAVAQVSRISNLSIRSRVASGAGLLTVGLTVGGSGVSGTKPLLLRAVGPTLAVFGVDGALADPQIALLSGSSIVAQNDDWGGNVQVATTGVTVGAFALISDASKDAALVPSAQPGGYTVRIAGAGNSAGIALAEVYDASPPDTFFVSTPRLTNISALTQVGSGGDILIAGFSISGSTSKQVLVRGIGPALAVFGVTGVLTDPKLELYAGGTNAVMAANDNWSDVANAADVATVASGVGAFALPPASKDAMLLVTLPPGSYTAQLSSANATTGSALVEIYEVP